MTVLYSATVEVPMFLSHEFDLSAAVQAGMRVTRVQPDDEIHAVYEGIRRDPDGWPIKIFTVKITRGEDD